MVRWASRTLLPVVFLTFVLSVVPLVSAQSLPVLATTTNGLSLRELLKKWENTTLDEVERRATNGDLTAQHYLGYCNAEGLRMAQNPPIGVAWYERALRGGYLPSANNLGLLHQRGLLGTKDLGQAVRYLNYAAERGLALAQMNLGRLYEEEGQPTEAFRAFQKAADQGSTDAMTALYRCYWGGKGVAKDHGKAMEWLTKAAEANNPYAQCLMGYRCESQEWEGEGENRHLTPKRNIEAFRWYRRSAEQDWAGGLYHLGLCYLAGEVVKRDEARGLELIRAAADKELNDAMRDLAGLYARGVGEPRHEQDRPVALLQRAGAWAELQMRYEHGLGTGQDFVAAARCHAKLLLTGDSYYRSPEDLVKYLEFRSPQRSWGTPMRGAPDGHAQLMGPPRDRDDVPGDDVLRALSLYLKSARADGKSAERIGDKYTTGDGVEQSSPKAWAWFSIAAQNGAVAGREQAAKLAARLGESEMAAGREYLRELRSDLEKVAAVVKN